MMKATPVFGAQPMPSQKSDEIAAWLLRAAGAGASAEQVASSIVATYQDIDGALTPIIGPRGVAALYHRSVHLARQTQPLLASVPTGVPSAMDLSPLKLLLIRQTPAAAAALGGLLLHIFLELLSALIGTSLTQRLLHSVWPLLLDSTSPEPAP